MGAGSGGLCICISADDVGRWPFSANALVKLAAFLSTLSWPGEVADLGPGGASFVELLILYERWAGERLRVEDSVPKYRRPGRPISLHPCALTLIYVGFASFLRA